MEAIIFRLANKLAYSLVLLAFLLSVNKCSANGISQNNNAQSISLQQALEIAKKELKSAGYPSWNEELIVKADDNNTFWKWYIEQQKQVVTIGHIEIEGAINSKSSSENYMNKLRENIMRMDNDAYWAIWYWPKKFLGQNVLGGDAWVIIRRSNGEVIGVILGK